MTPFRVAFGLSFVLVHAKDEREAVSLVRDKIDRWTMGRSRARFTAADFTVRRATPTEVAMMKQSHPSRNDQGVLDL